MSFLKAMGLHRSLFKKSFTVSLFAGLMVLSFQNCGDRFQAVGTVQSGSAVFSSTNSSGLKVTGERASMTSYGLVSVAKGTTFHIEAGMGLIADPTLVQWENIYSDGMLFCEQTTKVDKSGADFTCPYDGLVTIILSTENLNGGNPDMKVVQVVVGQVTGDPRAPIPGGLRNDPGKVPFDSTPTPTPTPVTGESLYYNNCMSCHGPAATTSKRGITRARLDSAIASVPVMKGLSTLSSSERDLIVNALK